MTRREVRILAGVTLAVCVWQTCHILAAAKANADEWSGFTRLVGAVDNTILILAGLLFVTGLICLIVGDGDNE